MLAHPHFRCPGFACNEYKQSNLSCPEKEGPYKKDSVEQFGIKLGNVDRFTIDCPLQDAMEVLDGLRVSRVSSKLTVNWCHMHVNRDIHGGFEHFELMKTCRFEG